MLLLLLCCCCYCVVVIVLLLLCCCYCVVVVVGMGARQLEASFTTALQSGSGNGVLGTTPR